MRIVLPLIAVAVATAAAPAPQPGRQPPNPELRVPGERGQRDCGDRIQEVRGERGLPRLDRDNAKPDEPLLIAAVDMRIGGCAVMVMYNDTSDVRELPTAPGGPPRVQRIPGQ